MLLVCIRKKAINKSKSHSIQRIAEAERESIRPFGRFTKRKGFVLDIDLIPFYNVPDLTGFKLKPYVPHTTPKIPDEIFEKKIEEVPEAIKQLELGPEETLPASDGRSSPSAGRQSRY